jgi:hypothetical protein
VASETERSRCLFKVGLRCLSFPIHGTGIAIDQPRDVASWRGPYPLHEAVFLLRCQPSLPAWYGAAEHRADLTFTKGVCPTLHEDSPAFYGVSDVNRFAPRQRQQRDPKPIPLNRP